jgi:hypothetical protein
MRTKQGTQRFGPSDVVGRSPVFLTTGGFKGQSLSPDGQAAEIRGPCSRIRSRARSGSARRRQPTSLQPRQRNAFSRDILQTKRKPARIVSIHSPGFWPCGQTCFEPHISPTCFLQPEREKRRPQLGHRPAHTRPSSQAPVPQISPKRSTCPAQGRLCPERQGVPGGTSHPHRSAKATALVSPASWP